MGLYVEIMCDVRIEGDDPRRGGYAHQHICWSDRGDNPQGHTVALAKKEARRLKWILGPGNRAVCPGCHNCLNNLPQQDSQLMSKEAVDALEKCRDRFREYEQHHVRNRDAALLMAASVRTRKSKSEFTKTAEEVAQKVDRNREMAELCETALSTLRSEAGDERAAIVAWLREQPSFRPISPDHVRATSPQWLAEAIERGDHLKSSVSPND